MKRMFREMRIVYSNRVIKEIALKMLLVYFVLGLATVLGIVKNSPIVTLDAMIIFGLIIPVVILVAIPIQWFLDIKPMTDRLYKEQKLKRRYAFYHNRFMKVE